MKYLVWDEPLDGLDEHGEPVTVTRQARIRCEDAPKLMRVVARRLGKVYTLTDQEAIVEASLINWGWIEEVPDDPK